jgi:hypothetical protein
MIIKAKDKLKATIFNFFYNVCELLNVIQSDATTALLLLNICLVYFDEIFHIMSVLGD